MKFKEHVSPVYIEQRHPGLVSPQEVVPSHLKITECVSCGRGLGESSGLLCEWFVDQPSSPPLQFDDEVHEGVFPSLRSVVTLEVRPPVLLRPLVSQTLVHEPLEALVTSLCLPSTSPSSSVGHEGRISRDEDSGEEPGENR